MAFSAAMQARLDTRDRRLAARLAERQGLEREQSDQEEAARHERQEILTDALEAARLAHGAIRMNVQVDLERYGRLSGWRVTQHEYRQRVRRDYGPSIDRLYGGMDPGGPEYTYESVGTNELILEEQGALWYVAHDAYFIHDRNNHPPIIPSEAVIVADRCTEGSFGEWSTKLASLALYNFIDNNRLVPFVQNADQQTGVTS